MLPVIAAATLLGVGGCGSDDDDEQAATTTTPAAGQVTTTSEDRSSTTADRGRDGRDGDGDAQLSAQGRAVLAATEDLAADVSETAEAFAKGDIDDEEAMARLELASDRAADLRDRAQALPAADRARSRLVSLNEAIGRTATDVSRLVTSGRTASRNEIDDRIDALRDEARSTFDAVSEQLDRPAQERLREALDRIGVESPG